MWRTAHAAVIVCTLLKFRRFDFNMEISEWSVRRGTQAVKAMLLASTHADLAALYNHDFECQVNVASDGGHKISGEYQGRQWNGWSDGITTWKSFRVPYKAKSEPEYTDTPMNFDLAAHAEGIGMTGWNWVERKSYWVAFDFDAMAGHSDKHSRKLTDEQLSEVAKTLEQIPYCTIRRSTSGKGLHIYIFLNPVPTANHTEHAALSHARFSDNWLLSRSMISVRRSISAVVICGSGIGRWPELTDSSC